MYNKNISADLSVKLDGKPTAESPPEIPLNMLLSAASLFKCHIRYDRLPTPIDLTISIKANCSSEYTTLLNLLFIDAKRVLLPPNIVAFNFTISLVILVASNSMLPILSNADFAVFARALYGLYKCAAKGSLNTNSSWFTKLLNNHLNTAVFVARPEFPCAVFTRLSNTLLFLGDAHFTRTPASLVYTFTALPIVCAISVSIWFAPTKAVCNVL